MNTAFSLGFLAWIIVGLLAGIVAKFIIPGRQGGGFLGTLIPGLLGAALGGLIAGLLPGEQSWGLWNPLTWVFSTIGAILVIVIWQWLAGRNSGSNTGAGKQVDRH